MDGFTQEVVAVVENAGGSMPYDALLAAFDYQKQQQLPRALKEAKKAGVLKPNVSFDPETGVLSHTIDKVG